MARSASLALFAVLLGVALLTPTVRCDDGSDSHLANMQNEAEKQLVLIPVPTAPPCAPLRAGISCLGCLNRGRLLICSSPQPERCFSLRNRSAAAPCGDEHGAAWSAWAALSGGVCVIFFKPLPRGIRCCSQAVSLVRVSFPGDVPVLSKGACAPWEQADSRTCTGQVEASKRKYDALQHHVAAIKLAEAADEDKVHPPARPP